MNKNYDALINVSLLTSEDGGRKKPIHNAYRGAHLIKEDYLTSASLDFVDVEILQPGDSAKAFVNYLSPEVYPKSLWIGKEMNIQEGGRLVGKATILEIYNETLRK